MLSVDNVGKNLDCRELEEMMAADGSKETEGLVRPTFPPVKMDTFTFQWVTWRLSIDFDEDNNLIQVIDVSEIDFGRRKNRRIQAILKLCSRVLQSGDIIEIVNQRTDQGEIQREHRSVLNIHMKIVRRE